MSRHAFLLLSVFGSCIVAFTSASRAIVTVVDFTPWTYRARIAAFGDQLEIGIMHDANLMLPPDESDPFLCDEPDEGSLRLALDSLDWGLPDDEIALLVSRGQCSFEQKARNALTIQKNVTERLRYLVVYNNDPEVPGDLVVMSSSSEDGMKELEDLALFFVSTSTGSAVLRKVSRLSESTGASPYFLDEESVDWRMPFLVEKIPPPDQNEPTPPFGPFSSGSGGGGNSRRGNAFYWLRFVLFALLIVAPCFRGFYLWYNGGGRFLLRRNDHGRIIGLQYIRPQPYWFAGGPVSNRVDQNMTERLTEEQVLALPEIEYQPTSTPEKQEDEEEGGATTEKEEPICLDEEEPETLQNNVEGGSDSSEEAEGVSLRTSCTTCSICIDDFEAGEGIRLLPRCRHAFHTECIMPWLTERQGCCPLCKTSVLENDQDTDSDTEEGTSQHPSEDSEA